MQVLLPELLYAILEGCLKSCVVGLQQEHNSVKFGVVADKLENCIHVLLVLFHSLNISDVRCVDEFDFVVDIFVLNCDDIRLGHLCTRTSHFDCVEILALVRSIRTIHTLVGLLPNDYPNGFPALVHCEAGWQHLLHATFARFVQGVVSHIDDESVDECGLATPVEPSSNRLYSSRSLNVVLAETSLEKVVQPA